MKTKFILNKTLILAYFILFFQVQNVLSGEAQDFNNLEEIPVSIRTFKSRNEVTRALGKERSLQAASFSCTTERIFDNPVNGVLKYYITVACNVGRPRSIITNLYFSNVDNPNSYTFIRRDSTFYCDGISVVCRTPTYTYSLPARTQIIKITDQEVIYDTAGIPSVSTISSSRRPFNDRGVIYPNYKFTQQPTKFQSVPFPYNGPYNKCADNQLLTPPCPRDGRYTIKVTQEYNSKNWLVPSKTPFVAHHIRPLSCGGGNSLNNAVLLPDKPNPDHQYFTTWWSSFRPKTTSKYCSGL